MKARTLESALEKVSRVITERYGLRLICRGTACQTDGKTICLPSLPDDVPEEVLGAIRGWADHECAHAIFTQTDIGPEFKGRHGNKAFAILNALEDARVESCMRRRYPGAGLNIEDGFRFISRKLAARPPATDLFQDFVSALYTRASRRSDQPWVKARAYGLTELCQEELSELSACRRTADVAALAERIWERFLGETQGDLGESEADRDAPELPEQNGNPGKEPGENPVPPQNAPEPQPANISSAQENQPLCPLDMLAREIQAQAEAHQPAGGGSYRVYTREYDVVEVPKPAGSQNWRRELETLRPYVSALSRRMVQTLLAERQTQWLRDRPRGSLDPRNLHRLATGRSSRIFCQRALTDGGKTACTLLLDMSSSMRGAQIELCRGLALIFAEMLDRLSFPTEIIGFSTVDRDLRVEIAQATGATVEELARRYSRMVPLYHALFKTFEEPWRAAAGRLCEVECRSLTPLGESLLFAGRRLCVRPERRKVLFCLTDGKPVVGAWDEQLTLDHARHAVLQLAQAGVEAVGIGIREVCVEGIFPRHTVIHDLAELPRGFVQELSSVLTAR
jgi:cobalamin biosynthesis protein CobT